MTVSVIGIFKKAEKDVLGTVVTTRTFVDTLEVKNFNQEEFDKWVAAKKKEFGKGSYLVNVSHSVFNN